jgi:hypothetical protein
MTAPEFNEMAALIVRLRTDLELHTDALVKSNAQCAEYLRKTEQMQAEHERLLRVCNDYEDAAADMHRELVSVRAALAATTEQRDSLQRTLDEWSNADTEPHDRVTAEDVADHVVPPVLPLCTTCHYCLHDLEASGFGPYHVCPKVGCQRTVTNNADGDDMNPYNGPCTSSHPVRHE